MELEIAKIITEHGGEIYEEYSGRGMCGKTTTGIQFDDEAMFFETIAEVMRSGSQYDRDSVAEFLTDIKKDSLGRGLIYY